MRTDTYGDEVIECNEIASVVTYTLPSELVSLFINNDWSIVDYIDDEHYEEAINAFLKELELDGVEIIDVVKHSNRFVKYHDMSDYGVLATDCCDYVGIINGGTK